MRTPIFYVPALHQEIVRRNLPPGLSFFPTGLSPTVFPSAEGQGMTSCEEDQAVESAAREALPLRPAEARAVLEEMLRMGEEYAPNGLLRHIAAHRFVQDGLQKSREAHPGEFADVERFLATGKASEENQAQEPAGETTLQRPQAELVSATRNALLDCQKILLLAFSREERLLELSRLEQQYREAEKALAAALGEGEKETTLLREEGDSAFAGENIPEFGEDHTVPWIVVVDALLPFLPDNGVLFTSDEAMARELEDTGLLQPVPAARAPLCADWSRELVEGLLYVNLPAWKLVGRKNLLPERPWLARHVEIFVSPPLAGWEQAPDSRRDIV